MADHTDAARAAYAELKRHFQGFESKRDACVAALGAGIAIAQANPAAAEVIKQRLLAPPHPKVALTFDEIGALIALILDS